MTLPLVILRPEPGWSASAHAARDMGLEVGGQPLFDAEPLDWTRPEGMFDGLLAGSSNVFRHGGEQLGQLAGLPVHCVGAATASAARDSGFDVASTGHGNLQAVVDALVPPRLLLRLCGEQRTELAVPAGMVIEEVAVYRTRPRELDDANLPDRAAVALHSGAAAHRFSHEVDRLGRERRGYVLCAISARAAKQAGEGWQAVAIAERPNDAALLALAKRLCQDSRERQKVPSGSRNG